MTDKATIAAMKKLDEAMKGMAGTLVPYNLIVDNFKPIQQWLNKGLRGDPADYGEEK